MFQLKVTEKNETYFMMGNSPSCCLSARGPGDDVSKHLDLVEPELFIHACGWKRPM
jgi:hypothetical protein